MSELGSREPTPHQPAEALPELMRLAKTLAGKFHYHYSDIDPHELISAANFGVTQAIQGYQPDRGAALTTYAYNLIINRLKEVVITHYKRIKKMPEVNYDDIITGVMEKDLVYHQLSPEDELLDRDIIMKAADFLQKRLTKAEWDKVYRYYYLGETQDVIGDFYGVTGAAIGDFLRKKVNGLVRKFLDRTNN